MNKTAWNRMAALAATCLIALAVQVRAAEKLPEGWLQDWDAAAKMAKESGKPVLAVFSAEWCGPCQHMIKTVYPEPEVMEALKGWVHVYLDEAVAPKKMKEHKIEAFPTFILFSPTLEEEDRFMGGRQKADFVKVLTEHPKLMGEIRELKAKLKKEPENAELWAKLGEAYHSKSKQEDAVEAWEKAAKLDPENKTGVADDLAYNKLFLSIQTSLDDMGALLKRFDAFRESFPESRYLPEAMFYSALLNAEMENYETSIGLLEAAIAKYPDNEHIEPMKSVLEQMQKDAAER